MAHLSVVLTVPTHTIEVSKHVTTQSKLLPVPINNELHGIVVTRPDIHRSSNHQTPHCPARAWKAPGCLVHIWKGCVTWAISWGGFIPMTYEMSTKGRWPHSFCYCFGAVTLHLRVCSWTAPKNIFWHIIRISRPQRASAKKQLKSRRYLPPPLLPAAKGAEVFRLQLSNFRFAFHRRGGVILVLPAAEDFRNHRRAGGSWKKWHGGRWGAWSSIHDALAVDMFSKMGTKITIFIGSLEKGE